MMKKVLGLVTLALTLASCSQTPVVSPDNSLAPQSVIDWRQEQGTPQLTEQQTKDILSGKITNVFFAGGQVMQWTTSGKDVIIMGDIGMGTVDELPVKINSTAQFIAKNAGKLNSLSYAIGPVYNYNSTTTQYCASYFLWWCTSYGTQTNYTTTTASNPLWPGGHIYYNFDTTMPPEMRTNIGKAISQWNNSIIAFNDGVTYKYSKLPLWKYNPSSANVVLFRYLPINSTANGTSSHIGKAGGVQYITINASNTSPALDDVGFYLHEMGHAAGLIHEHQRPDRNEYVTVYDQNIHPSRVGDLSIWVPNGNSYTYTNGNTTTTVAPTNPKTRYDYESMMHYAPYFGSNGSGPTISPKWGVPGVAGNPGNMGIQNRMTDEDAFGLLSLYHMYAPN